MRAGGAGAGELEHLRSERGEHPVVCGERRIGGVEPVEERRHLRQRALVRPGLPHAVDERAVADPDADEEATAVLVRQLGVTSGGLLGRVHPEVEDARGHGRRGRRAEEAADGLEHVTADVRHPQHRVTELLQLGRRGGRLGGVAVAQRAAPDPRARDVRRHVASLADSAAWRRATPRHRWRSANAGGTRSGAMVASRPSTSCSPSRSSATPAPATRRPAGPPTRAASPSSSACCRASRPPSTTAPSTATMCGRGRRAAASTARPASARW